MREKKNIRWLLRVAVHSHSIKEDEVLERPKLIIPYKKRNKTVIITGSGPAGFFAAFTLQQAGFDITLIERGAEVVKREQQILEFEKTAVFRETGNYAFGEGGAGTFSDGKLTSRSKHISAEREYFMNRYIDAGAPEEIRYMTYPHVGSDNLKRIVVVLREQYKQLGGRILFETLMHDMVNEGGRIKEVITGSGHLAGDDFIVAPGHSSYETYRMLMKRGVGFRTKNFALGFRAEHRQELINRAQWGIEKLAGVKAAEYRVTSEADGKHPVYSFCMCPGGIVVPAGAYKHVNIVNGMSNYRRDGRFGNAACVAGVHPDQLAGKVLSPTEALDWLEKLEMSFFDYSGGYHAPSCAIGDFIQGRLTDRLPETSYPLGIIPAPLWNMLPDHVITSLREGLTDFARKIKGYEQGILLGLESKTSSPIQVLRGDTGLCEGFENLFLVGEGSGYAGGIVSSAADGIKTAMHIIAREN